MKLIRAKWLKSDNFVTDEMPVQLLDDSLTDSNNSCHPDEVQWFKINWPRWASILKARLIGCRIFIWSWTLDLSLAGSFHLSLHAWFHSTEFPFDAIPHMAWTLSETERKNVHQQRNFSDSASAQVGELRNGNCTENGGLPNFQKILQFFLSSVFATLLWRLKKQQLKSAWQLLRSPLKRTLRFAQSAWAAWKMVILLAVSHLGFCQHTPKRWRYALRYVGGFSSMPLVLPMVFCCVTLYTSCVRVSAVPAPLHAWKP